MNVIYPIGKWNNSSRARARHIPNNDDGRPLCWKPEKFMHVFSWESEEGEPTCKDCVRIHTIQQGEESAWQEWVDEHPLDFDAEVWKYLRRAFSAGYYCWHPPVDTRPDPLGEALNSGDGVYRP